MARHDTDRPTPLTASDRARLRAPYPRPTAEPRWMRWVFAGTVVLIIAVIASEWAL